MKVVDCHVHVKGNVNVGEISKILDKKKTNIACLFSENPNKKGSKVKEYISRLSEISKKANGRIIPFAFIDPTYPKIMGLLDWAVKEKGIKGFKIIPDGWFPWDKRVLPVYKKISELNKPILFHSGILWTEGDTSRFCRPAEYEILYQFPKVKFALAHISWPWTDECIAVVQKIKRMRPDNKQAYIDLTPGTPDNYREDAVKKALALVGPESLIWGSDSSFPADTVPTGSTNKDNRLFTKLGLNNKQKKLIFSDNFKEFIS
ncbi:MAG: hypothetical protein A2252_11665 [Elusimicrobia bacterium RIFOXYA2_FULL_39_19]|nr:MAG: hypothetical protein A2252_11665 [Elusimicrobia bacterium RIFOXYA2_FULL_39_19]